MTKRPLPFSLRLPMVVAPMFLVSGPEMVIEASRSGVIGSFPTQNCRTSEELEGWLSGICEALESHSTSAVPGEQHKTPPWSVNLITHRTNSRMAADLALIEQYKPPLVITALGSPKPVIEAVHGYGGVVFADVTSLTLARKAAEAGVDGLVCVSAGAGGHTGPYSPFAFVAAVREFFDGWIAVSGGIGNGQALYGAIAAGADLAYLGTRFLSAAESMAQTAYKRMVIECGLDDLVVSAAVSGASASWLRPSLINAGIDLDHAQAANFDAASDAVARRWRDIWAAGQSLTGVRSQEPLHEIVNQLQQEWGEAQRSMQSHSVR